jgi:hypothetical protein
VFAFRVSITTLITGASVFLVLRILNVALGVSLMAAAGSEDPNHGCSSEA